MEKMECRLLFYGCGMESEVEMGRILIGILLLAVAFCLYCCIRVGSQADDWMEDHPFSQDGEDGRDENG